MVLASCNLRLIPPSCVQRIHTSTVTTSNALKKGRMGTWQVECKYHGIYRSKVLYIILIMIDYEYIYTSVTFNHI